jgi:predicted RNA-binding protein YlxR (DUF448 family)
MAVGSKAATDPDQSGARAPIRTCIGCRQRSAAAQLLRVVAGPSGAGHPVLPDPDRRAAGRGAWVHPDPDCVALAERRRAYGRALRVPGPADPTAVREYVARRATKPNSKTDPTGGNPQE